VDRATPRTLRQRLLRRWPLLLLLAGALGVRLAWGLSQPVTDEWVDRLPDQREYLSIARNLRSGAGLQFYEPRFRDIVYAFRTPGYPLFVAAFDVDIRLTRAAQALVDTSTVLAVYLLAVALVKDPGRNGRRLAPLVAGALVAANPYLVYFSSLILSETLFTAMLAWGMLLLVAGGRGARLRLDWERFLDTGHPQRLPRPGLGTVLWLLGGLILASSVLVRPAAAPLPLVLGVAAAFLGLQNRAAGGPYDYGAGYGGSAQLRWPLPVGATMLLLTAVVLLPWGLRNRRVLGEWVWTTTNAGFTAYDGFHPEATGASDQRFLEEMPYLSQMTEVTRSRYLSEKAGEYAREHPRHAAELALAKAGRTWSLYPRSREYGHWKHRLVGLAYGLPFYLMVLGGLWGGRLGRAAKVFLLLPAIYLTGVHMLSVGSLRYRLPAEPPMAVLAASVLASPRPGWKRAGAEGSDGVSE
jgi:hypothetical protein